MGMSSCKTTIEIKCYQQDVMREQQVKPGVMSFSKLFKKNSSSLSKIKASNKCFSKTRFST